MPLLTESDCWCLAGATAVGKTSTALKLAEAINAEIMSLDSMAVYRGMDIGTAKPTPEQQSVVKHHLIDLRDPSEEFSVAEYIAEAERAVEEARSRGKQSLFVGGTPMYLKCLLRGLFDGPSANPRIREELQSELDEVGPKVLHERLALVDPLAASTIHPNDARRIVRALEVFRSTGEPISHQQMEFEDPVPSESCRVFVLRRERSEQHERIEQRVDQMIADGLIDEVEELTANGKELGTTAKQAVGYSEVLGHLHGELELADAIEKIKTRTRRFAKQQGTWFRGLEECRFVDLTADDSAEIITERIQELAD